MFPVLITTVCAEPAITFVILMIAKIPKISKYELSRIMNEEDENLESYSLEKRKIPLGPFETALVIPCHNTDESTIRTTIDSALPHFRAQDIFIVYNGPTRYPKHPTCNFRSYIRSIHPDIVYIWSPIGSKNAAQFIGTLAAKDYKYIMTVDDDVCIPKNYYIPKEMIDDKFKAVAYGIKAIDAKGNTPLWLVAWQDVEYRLSGLSKAAEDRLCGVLFPHGAGWFLERECFAKMLENYHPMDFIAEDCNAGLGIHKMGKGIRYEGRCFLATEAPRSFFGPGLNWWKQRQKSWEMGRHGRLFALLKQLFFCLPARKTPQG
jgi:cellulose synthase/poly-beta-1,6-N-acetylglucosamine synthase-like glycosyltransferase